MSVGLEIKLPQDWLDQVGEEFDRSYMQSLDEFLKKEAVAGHVVYPPPPEIFAAFYMTSFADTKVVILGQDPYHGPDQAHGLSFSVKKGVKLPPSLRNIYKEIESEFGIKAQPVGDLSTWARQGVLLLNATLTVRQGEAGSHQNKGWEEFTDAVIRAVDKKDSRVIFMLWGSYAQKKCSFIDRKKHLVLEAPHPSPLSAHRGFLGCGHFKRANEDLQHNGQQPIDWTRQA
jgi:uracil-DNA glycosylase